MKSLEQNNVPLPGVMKTSLTLRHTKLGHQNLTIAIDNFSSLMKSTLSTRSRVIPSYQGDSIIFHNDNFLQLQRIVLPHPPFCWTKERAQTTYSVIVGKLMRIELSKKQSRMSFLSIKLVMIDNNSSSMHREYYKFYAVHVYLRSIRISLIVGSCNLKRVSTWICR